MTSLPGLAEARGLGMAAVRHQDVVDLDARDTRLGYSRQVPADLNVANPFDRECFYPSASVRTWISRGTLGEGRMLRITLGWGSG